MRDEPCLTLSLYNIAATTTGPVPVPSFQRAERTNAMCMPPKLACVCKKAVAKEVKIREREIDRPENERSSRERMTRRIGG